MSQKKKNGFTLIELVLVIGLTALAVGITSDTLLSIVRSYGKAQVKSELEQQANFISLKIGKELIGARNVTATGTTLTFTDTYGNVETYSLVAPGILKKTTVAAGVTFDLTYNTPPGGVVVSCPTGSCFTVSNTTPVIADMNLRFTPASANGGSYSGTFDLVKTFVIRSSY